MDSSDWPPCIVTHFDLPGIKEEAPTGMASQKMIQMRNFAVEQLRGASRTIRTSFL